MIETALIVFITLSASAGSFYWGRHISSIQQRSETLETGYKEAVKHIEEVEQRLEEALQENEYMRQERDAQKRQITPPRAWDPQTH